MQKSGTLAIRISEIRQRLREFENLEGDAFTDDIRQESDRLQVEFRDKETQYRSALITEGDAERRAATDGEGKEMGQLEQRASLGRFYAAHLSETPIEGPEKELAEHYKLPRNQIPIALARGAGRPEHRAIATLTGDVGASAAPALLPILARGDARFLGGVESMVPAGDAIYPILTNSRSFGDRSPMRATRPRALPPTL